MGKFIKQIFATIIGIFLFFIILFLLLFFKVSFFNKSKTEAINNSSVLEIDMNYSLYKEGIQNIRKLTGLTSQQLLLGEILHLIKEAKNDPKIKGISLKLTDVNREYAQIEELRNALKDFRKSGKFVYSYLSNSSQKAYYLSTVSDSIFLNPNSMLDLKGLSIETTFYKGFEDKYGIEVELIKYGKYKSAIEPFIRNNYSEENRMQLSSLISDMWSRISSDIVADRKIDSVRFQRIADSLYAFIPEKALKNNLVDKLVYESEYDAAIKDRFLNEKEEKITLNQYYQIKRSKLNDNRVAVLYASGQIYDGNGNIENGVFAENFIKDIKKITDDARIKSVVLRINSPGGSGSASDEILNELKKLHDKKPIIVSFGDYAASGGYYIAMASDKIFSEETTITGSIGVFSAFPKVKKLADNVGITTDYVSTNQNSVNYSLINGLSEGTHLVIAQEVDRFYKQFVGVVMENRKKTFEQIDSIGQGRVWSGKSALKIGLVDSVGGLDAAISEAAKQANIKDYTIDSYPKIETSILQELQEILEKKPLIEEFAKAELGEQYEFYKQYKLTKEMFSRKGIYYMIPFEFKVK